MKQLFKKKWRSIPVGIIAAALMVCLLAGGAFAAYTFTGMNVTVNVDEPLQVQYNLTYEICDEQGCRTDETGWQDLPSGGLTLEADFSAGDVQTLYLRMNNRANSPLTVSTLLGGDASQFDLTGGFPDGQVVPKSTGFDFGNGAGVSDANAAEWTSDGIPIGISGEAPPGTYTLTIEFERS